MIGVDVLKARAAENGQIFEHCCSDVSFGKRLRRGVRSDAQLSCTETRF